MLCPRIETSCASRALLASLARSRNRVCMRDSSGGGSGGSSSGSVSRNASSDVAFTWRRAMKSLPISVGCSTRTRLASSGSAPTRGCVDDQPSIRGHERRREGLVEMPNDEAGGTGGNRYAVKRTVCAIGEFYQLELALDVSKFAHEGHCMSMTTIFCFDGDQCKLAGGGCFFNLCRRSASMVVRPPRDRSRSSSLIARARAACASEGQIGREHV